MAKIQKGDTVQIHYTGKLEDGTVFDTSEGRDPLQFEAGSEQLIPGVSRGVIGMEEGEEKQISVPPEQGYGPRRPELEQEVPRTSLPQDVKQGDPLRAQAGEQEIRVWVKELKDETATVDANHPLAGKTLNFDLKVVSISPA
ncbi:MAG: peptidylprolyl isomerase [Candidatus Eisenbacteria bacterium]|nr:peptidylprolyl isomerase [Candidatus Eisenbacteria bacterium]